MFPLGEKRGASRAGWSALSGRRQRVVGLTALALGALVLALNGAYLGYVAYARNQVGDVTVQRPLSIPPTASDVWRAPSPGGAVQTAAAPGAGVTPSSSVSASPDATVKTEEPARASPPLPFRAPLLSPDDDPLQGQLEEELKRPSGFRPVTPEDLRASGAAPPTRVRVPAINLDARVEGLRILNLANSREYETPKNVVGHIPESANLGVRGQVWLFGHLESPIRGEGSIFQDLPGVYGLLQKGLPVYVVLDNSEGSFLYQVQEFRKVHQDAFYLQDSQDPLVSLVTCWPLFKYDERIVVTAKLIGIGGAGPA